MHTGAVKAIQIRNVPDDVHAMLQRRADAAGQSMREYLLAPLREHAGSPTMQEWIEQAARQAGGRLSLEEAVTWQRDERDAR